MHELAVCQALLAQVISVAAGQSASSVESVTVAAGALSGVEPALLERAWPLAAAGTLAQAAQLEIRVLPVRVRCQLCGHETETGPNRLLCAGCGSWQTTVLSGDELMLLRVTLVQPDCSQSGEEEHV